MNEDCIRQCLKKALEEKRDKDKPKTVEEMEKRVVDSIAEIIVRTSAGFVAGLFDNYKTPEDAIRHTHSILLALLVKILEWDENKARTFIKETAAKTPDFTEILLAQFIRLGFHKKE